eukprot:7538212-Alexandrium_andersonii.AAC.1
MKRDTAETQDGERPNKHMHTSNNDNYNTDADACRSTRQASNVDRLAHWQTPLERNTKQTNAP